MDFETVFQITDQAIFVKEGKHLKDIERIIIKGTWDSQTYDHIAETCSVTTQHIKNESNKLWQRLEAAFGEKVTKKNFRTVLERRAPQKQNFQLAEHLRALFEALDYTFEKHELREKSYFEWVIRVPVWPGYNLVLVRGVEGEVGIKDVETLRQSVKQQKTDKGWLITTRRISHAACKEIEKSENRHLSCYTFDRLLDEVADFSNYFERLEAEVKSKKIDLMYVPLACRKDEFDLVTKQKIGTSRYDENDGWIDGYVDIWLDDPAKEHLSILGEFGTGKTWFAFHYAWICLQRYRDAKKRGVQLPRLPLLITLRDYARALDVENVLASFFFSQHNIRSNIKVFDLLNQMGKLLLIFDGFDEMAAKVDRQKMINNFWELAKIVVPGSKVILTCRTEHFPEAQEGRALLNAELLASTANLTGEAPQFEVLELEKFNDEQIRQVLSFHAEPATVEIVMGNPQWLDLARRPLMVDSILEALPKIKPDNPLDISRVYLLSVNQKMERDIKTERTFTSLADKLYFLCELSWEMLSTDQMSLNYRLFPDRIRRLFSSVVQKEKDLDHWHYDMMGQTMLIRNDQGDYTPAHRSLLEFFVAYKFAAELGALAKDFTGLAQARSDLDNSAAPVDYTWSGYFVRRLDKAGNLIKIPPLNEFKSEPLEYLRQTFGKAPLTKAVIDLLLPMFNNKESLIHVIEATRGKSEDEVCYVGGNAATLLVKLDKAALEGKDLSCTVIKGADFTNASLRGVNFSQANLSDSVFTKILGHIYSVAFSPNGKLLATGDSNGVVHLWEAVSGKEILTCKGHILWVRSVAFSPDGTILASGSNDRTVRLWDTNSGECLYTLQGHTKGVYSIAFSPDGTILASGSSDHTVRLWDINSGECRNTLEGDKSWVCSVAFSPDGVTLASAGGDQVVRLWDINSGECRNTLQGHNRWINSVAFSPDGITLASGGTDNTVRLWDINSGECLYILEHTSWVSSVTFSPDGATLASAGDEHTVRLWDINTGKCRNILQGHNSWVCSITFSPKGAILASSSEDGTIRLWNTSSGECCNILKGHTSWSNSLAFSSDGVTLASGSGGEDNTMRLWDINTGECRNTLQGHGSWICSVAFSPDGKTLASGSADFTARLWDINSGICFHCLQGHTSRVYSVVFSPDGATLASASTDGTIKLWCVKTGECLKTLINERPCERMNITGVKGLTEAEIASLKALGAVEDTTELTES
jgi:predicted NACHT family NTPase